MIILLGFPKSGTTSFQYLFTKLGYKSVHWTIKTDKCDHDDDDDDNDHNNDKNKNDNDDNVYVGVMIKNNKDNNRPLLHGLKEYDCITQMDVCMSSTESYWPQLTDYKQLYHENSDAIFILNKRDPLKILSSFKRWNNVLGANLFERSFEFSSDIFSVNTDEGFIEVVERHYHDVEHFFQQRAGAKFLTYDIETDSLNKLSDYIDLKDETELPVCNTKPEKKEIV